MSDPTRVLSDDEVRQISLLIESLDRSTLDFLQLEFGDVKLMIGKGSPPPMAMASPSASAAAAPQTIPEPPAPVAAATHPLAPPATTGEADQKDTVAITAPMLGRFYGQPEPGAPPFVSVGSEVTEQTTVAIIEVMKTFNAIPAGLCGVITEICAKDTQFVEFGQVLFRVRPLKMPQWTRS
jgi:acetyl-CoA carboxylase biotin carboxyl carrier protein